MSGSLIALHQSLSLAITIYCTPIKNLRCPVHPSCLMSDWTILMGASRTVPEASAKPRETVVRYVLFFKHKSHPAVAFHKVKQS